MEREEIVMLVAANIETAMSRRGINPAELARRAGINPTGVYDILSGKSRSPRLDTIGKIARALSVPVAFLFEEYADDDLRARLMSVVDGLPPDERKRLLLVAQSWAAESGPSH